MWRLKPDATFDIEFDSTSVKIESNVCIGATSMHSKRQVMIPKFVHSNDQSTVNTTVDATYDDEIRAQLEMHRQFECDSNHSQNIDIEYHDDTDTEAKQNVDNDMDSLDSRETDGKESVQEYETAGNGININDRDWGQNYENYKRRTEDEIKRQQTMDSICSEGGDTMDLPVETTQIKLGEKSSIL